MPESGESEDARGPLDPSTGDDVPDLEALEARDRTLRARADALAKELRAIDRRLIRLRAAGTSNLYHWSIPEVLLISFFAGWLASGMVTCTLL